MSEWGLLCRMVRVKTWSLSRVIPKGNGGWEVWLPRRRKAITLLQQRKIEQYGLVRSYLQRYFPLHFFPFPSLSKFVCNTFSLQGAVKSCFVFCILYCNTRVKEASTPFKHKTKFANWKGFILAITRCRCVMSSQPKLSHCFQVWLSTD